MACARCGHALFLDQRSVGDASILGYEGGRQYCLMGCPQPNGGWNLQRLVSLVEMPIKEEHRGHRDEITIICVDCQAPVPTKGRNTRRCPTCSRNHRREIERARAHKEVA